MNVSLIITTEGYTAFYGVVRIYDGREQKTLFTGERYEVNECVPSHVAEQRAYEDGATWVRENLPLFAEFINR